MTRYKLLLLQPWMRMRYAHDFKLPRWSIDYASSMTASILHTVLSFVDTRHTQTERKSREVSYDCRRHSIRAPWAKLNKYIRYSISSQTFNTCSSSGLIVDIAGGGGTEVTWRFGDMEGQEQHMHLSASRPIHRYGNIMHNQTKQADARPFWKIKSVWIA